MSRMRKGPLFSRSILYLNEDDYSAAAAASSMAPNEVDSMQMNDATMSSSRSMMRRTRKKEKQTQRQTIIQEYKNHWARDPPNEFPKSYYEPFEASLVSFFRSGYERYWNDGEHAKDEEILEFVKHIIASNKLLISGGYILENTGLSAKNRLRSNPWISIFICLIMRRYEILPFMIPWPNYLIVTSI